MSAEEHAKELWGDLVKNTMSSTADVAQGRSPTAEHTVEMKVSSICSVKLGGSTVRKNGGVVIIEVRIERGRSKTSRLDYTHVLHSDTQDLGKMLARAEGIALSAFKGTLSSALRDIAHALINQYGVEDAQSAFNTALVEDVMES